MFASILGLLFVAHLLSDFAFQTDHQAAHKADHSVKGWLANATHAGTHVLASAVALGIGVLALELDLSTPAGAIALAWIGMSHGAIDRRCGVRAWMRFAGQADFAKNGGAAQVDQTAHIVALAVAALMLAA